MSFQQYTASHLHSSSFTVDYEHLNADAALSTCRILSTILNLNDEAIVAVFGTLDFGRITPERFCLDFTGNAFVNDIVTISSHIRVLPDQLVEIAVSGHKRKGRRQVPIVSGRFVFVIRQGVVLHDSRLQ